MKVFKLTITLCILMCINMAQAQNTNTSKNNKYVQTTIQTNGTCEKCKNTIENNIAYEKGVKDVVYDMATSKVSIVYNPKKNTTENLCKAINKLGFTAKEASQSSACSHQCDKNGNAKCSSHSQSVPSCCNKEGESGKPCCKKDGEEKKCCDKKNVPVSK